MKKRRILSWREPLLIGFSLLQLQCAGTSQMREEIDYLKSENQALRERLTATERELEPKKVLEPPKISPARNAPGDTRSLTEPMRWYYRGVRLFQEKRYSEAVHSLKQFLQQNPEHVYADRAQFWVGESYLQLGNCPLALASTEAFESLYPFSFRLPEVLYQRGKCLKGSGDTAGATHVWERLIRDFPSHPISAKLVQELSLERG